MKLSQLVNENVDINVNDIDVHSRSFRDTDRIPRVTFKHLLKLSQQREEKKLDRIKDDKLCTIMYKLDTGDEM